MAVDEDVREIRGHVLRLVEGMGKLQGTLDSHVRPCADVKAAHIRLDKMEQSGGGNNAVLKNEQGIVRLLINKVVGPLVAAVSGVLAYIFATGAKH